MLVQENLNLKNYNTFRVSVSARYFAAVSKLTDLSEALAFSKAHGLTFMILGEGSNLLFKEDYPGLIIKLNITGVDLIKEDGEHAYVKAHCGENWHEFVQFCLQSGYYGLENLSLIPGTVGAAPVQNIGAYGVELSDFLHELEALEISTGKLVKFNKEECSLAYRDSIFKAELKDKFVILNVTFKLLKQAQPNLIYPALHDALSHYEAEEINPLLISETVCNIRRSKLPDPGELANAGSFFWNPIVSTDKFLALKETYPEIAAYPYNDRYKLAAAWLIEQTGWKGYRKADAGVHAKHALVLVNYGEASGAELYDLSRDIQQSVKEKFDIELQAEVRVI